MRNGVTEQAVIVKFDYVAASLEPLYAVEDRLSEAFSEAGEGECDGHDVTPDLKRAAIYLYGTDADVVFDLSQSVFESADCVHNAVATIRYGPPEDGVRERVVRLVRQV